jgi:hypothetical protein
VVKISVLLWLISTIFGSLTLFGPVPVLFRSCSGPVPVLFRSCPLKKREYPSPSQRSTTIPLCLVHRQPKRHQTSDLRRLMLLFWSVIVRFLATSKIRPGTAREVGPTRKAASDPLVPLIKTPYKYFHNHLVSPLQLHNCHIMSSSSSSSSDTDDVVLASSYKKTITSPPRTTFCLSEVSSVELSFNTLWSFGLFHDPLKMLCIHDFRSRSIAIWPTNVSLPQELSFSSIKFAKEKWCALFQWARA